jgi:GTP pyrophosphokinase
LPADWRVPAASLVARIAPVLHGLRNEDGEDVFEHALATAVLVSELRLGLDTGLAALLTPLVDLHPEWLDEYGLAGELAHAVAAMRQIETLSRAHADADVDPHAQLEALRRMVLAMVQDVRAVLIKLAERTHTLRHAARAPSETRRRQLGQEARDLYAPLANRLGVWQLKWELEDWACRFLESDTYRRIAELLDEKRADRERYIASVVVRVEEELRRVGLVAEVRGRPKHIASIINKMRRKNLGFEQLYDIRAVRVLVEKESDCYTVLGVLHNLWQPISGEFDDYISHPKTNDYRSLHTAVIGPEARALEVQIRSFEMHRHAELGVAAHWRYKEGGKSDPHLEEKIAWLRQLLEWKDDVADSSEFAEQFRTELFQDQVYVLTPQSRVVALTRGATPVDFAYALHTELGHRCRGARVDGVMVPLDTPLANGQRVEILSIKDGGPSRDWLNPQLGYLKTNRARAKARQWFKARDQGELDQLGRQQLEREIKRLGITPPGIEQVAHGLKYRDAHEFLVALGRGDVGHQILLRALREQSAPEVPRTPRARPINRTGEGVHVEGLGEIPVTLAGCCRPRPPMEIVAYPTVGRGVTVHRSDCPSLKRFDASRLARLMPAQWGAAPDGRGFLVELDVRAFDRQGLLRDVSEVFTQVRMDVLRVNSETRGELMHMALTVRLRDPAELGRLLHRLTQVKSVIEVNRQS